MQYPLVKKIPIIDTYFNTQVVDNYRWLEDEKDQDVAKFIEDQNDLTNQIINDLPEYDYFLNQITADVNYEKVISPVQVGRYIYYFYNSGLDNQPSLRRTESTVDKSEIVFDPIKFNSTGKTSVGDVIFDDKNNRLALVLNDNGSDVGYAKFLDLGTLEMLPDVIQNIKFSDTVWYNQGLLYSRYPEDMDTQATAQKINLNHTVFYHKLGTSQQDDILIFQDLANPKQSHGVAVSSDQKTLILSKSQSTSINTIAVASIEGDNLTRGLEFRDLLSFENSAFYFLYKKDDYLYFLTNYEASNYQIIKCNCADILNNQYETVVAQTKQPIEEAVIVSDKIIISRLVDVASVVEIYNLNGQIVKNLDIPKYSTVSISSNEQSAFLSLVSFLNPGTKYQIELEALELIKFFETPTVTDLSKIIIEQIWYKSLDNTEIPMYILRDKSTKLDGMNPAYLYGYGGFNVSVLPNYVPSRLAWLAKGGIIAIANIRGGGEYGKSWYMAGTQMQKQNVFDDFIFAGQYLIDSQYTSSKYLTIEGSSNGGLLTAACGLQRPDLFNLVMVDVGVLDMLRYNLFTIGWAWATDYGTSSQSKEMFEYLYKYSPVHNCKPKKYPRFLISTADHDDRVVPIHSFKFAASLQAAQLSDNPILLQVHTKSGHGAGKNLDQKIIEAARNWSYIWDCCKVEKV